MIGQAPKLSLEFITGKGTKHLAVKAHNERFPESPILISGRNGALVQLPRVETSIFDTPTLRAEQEEARSAAEKEKIAKQERRADLDEQWKAIKKKYAGSNK